MQLSEQAEIKALVTGIHQRRLLLGFSDALFGVLLISLLILNPLTPAIDQVDVAIVATMLLCFVGGFVFLNISQRQHTYFQFQLTTSIALIGAMLILANSLYGSHAQRIAEGHIPWISAYVGLLVAYLFAFLSFRDAVKRSLLFAGGNFLLLSGHLLLYKYDSWEGVSAVIWTAGAITTALLHIAILMRIQTGIHGETVRSIMQDQLTLESENKRLERKIETDPETGLYAGWAGRAYLMDELCQPGPTQLLYVHLQDYTQQRQIRDAQRFEQLLKELTDICKGFLPESAQGMRIHQDTLLFWTSEMDLLALEIAETELRKLLRPEKSAQHEARLLLSSLSSTSCQEEHAMEHLDKALSALAGTAR